ncbi:GNAT family N-acetyltransferase [Anaerobacillus sp. CMMVII]|uniref:GNAT family N-acetyltransferase n=1 Tax=Anaerobacillus sp. CMMVII TaxID=2755588 RepID=UPI0021B6F576|nr:GNAT family N-acetyltransferase [Anaerobacillus sp. CMMVII]MCT8138116.1 GNAT family N-acetyltransferase [Anaerobacillus sp. CMMVII]
MNSFTFIKDYKHHEQYRASFNELAKSTFQIDFEPWYQQGFWNDRYICYSYLDNDKIVANVSISKMQMVIEGVKKHAIQIGTVMTHPDYQKQGLAGSLMNKVIAEHEQENDLFFLFADEDVHNNFYKKYGFHQVHESTFSISVQSTDHTYKSQKLSFEGDKQMIFDYYAKKNSSHNFDIEKGEHVLGFYSIYGFGNSVYYIEELDAVVIYQRKAKKLHIYGVFSDQQILLHDLLTYISTNETTEVVFYYTPDFKDLHSKGTRILTTDDLFLVRTASVKFPEYFKFPLIAHA